MRNIAHSKNSIPSLIKIWGLQHRYYYWAEIHLSLSTFSAIQMEVVMPAAGSRHLTIPWTWANLGPLQVINLEDLLVPGGGYIFDESWVRTPSSWFTPRRPAMQYHGRVFIWRAPSTVLCEEVRRHWKYAMFREMKRKCQTFREGVRLHIIISFRKRFAIGYRFHHASNLPLKSKTRWTDSPSCSKKSISTLDAKWMTEMYTAHYSKNIWSRGIRRWFELHTSIQRMAFLNLHHGTSFAFPSLLEIPDDILAPSVEYLLHHWFGVIEKFIGPIAEPFEFSIPDIFRVDGRNL